jgi:hypothetical protein
MAVYTTNHHHHHHQISLMIDDYRSHGQQSSSSIDHHNYQCPGEGIRQWGTARPDKKYVVLMMIVKMLL